MFHRRNVVGLRIALLLAALTPVGEIVVSADVNPVKSARDAFPVAIPAPAEQDSGPSITPAQKNQPPAAPEMPPAAGQTTAQPTPAAPQPTPGQQPAGTTAPIPRSQNVTI